MSSFTIADLPEVFEDVDPVPQDDGPTSVCRIDYPPNFVKAYDYFRAILRRKELTPRALQLTRLCLEQNPANYTVWHYRRLCLYATAATTTPDDWKTLIPNDLALAAELGGANPKNYQIWYHRRAILTEFDKQGGDLLEQFAEPEMKYVATVLEADGKNYHAWSHRQWLLRTINNENIWKDELAYTDELIGKDIRNNSAWNQRWFVTHRDGGTTADAFAEVDYALTKAAADPFNESPFTYFLAICKELYKNESKTFQTEYLPKYVDKLRALVPLNNDDAVVPVSPHALGAQVECLAYLGDADSLQTASILLDRLA
eukprot:scaffold46522_cov168-Amphora_coffeaeformis.AAC.1